MALLVESAKILSLDIGPNTYRRRLLDSNIQPVTRTVVDQIELGADGSYSIYVPSRGVTYLQVLSGSANLATASGDHELDDRHVAFLPPSFDGSLQVPHQASILAAEVPDAVALNPAYAGSPAPFRIIDRRNEALLNSVNDARKRIYLATPKLFGNKAIKAEMIIYPPNTTGANHYHEGADHFMYFTAGSGTAYSNEQSFRVKQVDVVYFADGERHYLTSDSGTEMVFVEFFTPGIVKTVWVESNAYSWTPSGKNILGEAASREIAAHSGGFVPEDV